MILDEKCCEDRINSFTSYDWQSLLALIPEIEKTSNFGELLDEGGGGEESTQFSYRIPVPIISQFLKIVYALPIVIGFDWGSWSEGRKIANDKNFDFDTTNLLTKCKLITAIVRNNRFCEGALASAFESGLILKILKSIKNEVISKR